MAHNGSFSSGLCFFWGIPSSSIWPESLLQGGPLFWGQAMKELKKENERLRKAVSDLKLE
jgi:hypothetical protein